MVAHESQSALDDDGELDRFDRIRISSHAVIFLNHRCHPEGAAATEGSAVAFRARAVGAVFVSPALQRGERDALNKEESRRDGALQNASGQARSMLEGIVRRFIAEFLPRFPHLLAPSHHFAFEKRARS